MAKWNILAAFRVTGAKEGAGDVKELGDSARNAAGGGGVGALDGALKGLIPTIAATAAAGVVLHKTLQFVEHSIAEASGKEEGFRRLENAVRRTAGAAGLTAQELRSLAVELQKVSTYGDDQIMVAIAGLMRYRTVAREVFEDAARLALDVAASGREIGSAYEWVGRILADPARGLQLLRRELPHVTAEIGDQVVALVELGRVTDAQRLIVAALSREYAGEAAAAAASYAGSKEQLSKVIGDLHAAFGEGLLPVLADSTQALKDLASDPQAEAMMRELGLAVGEAMRTVAAFSPLLFPLVGQLKLVANAAEAAGMGMQLIARAVPQAMGQGGGLGAWRRALSQQAEAMAEEARAAADRERAERARLEAQRQITEQTERERAAAERAAKAREAAAKAQKELAERAAKAVQDHLVETQRLGQAMAAVQRGVPVAEVERLLDAARQLGMPSLFDPMVDALARGSLHSERMADAWKRIADAARAAPPPGFAGVTTGGTLDVVTVPAPARTDEQLGVIDPAARAEARRNKLIAEGVALVERLTTAEEHRARAQEALSAAHDDGKISAEQYKRALREIEWEAAIEEIRRLQGAFDTVAGVLGQIGGAIGGSTGQALQGLAQGIDMVGSAVTATKTAQAAGGWQNWAMAAAGWVGVIVAVWQFADGWVKNQKAKRTVGRIEGGMGGMIAISSEVGLEDELRKVGTSVQSAIQELARLAGGTVESLRDYEINVKGNGRIWARIRSETGEWISREFGSIEAASDWVLRMSLAWGKFGEVSERAAHIIRNAARAGDISEVAGLLGALRDLEEDALGPVERQIREISRGSEELTLKFRELGVSVEDLSAARVGRSLDAVRSGILGIQETAEERLRRQSEEYNREAALTKARWELLLADALLQAESLESRGRMIEASAELADVEAQVGRSRLETMGELIAAEVAIVGIAGETLEAIRPIIESARETIANIRMITEEDIQEALGRLGSGSRGGQRRGDRERLSATLDDLEWERSIAGATELERALAELERRREREMELAHGSAELIARLAEELGHLEEELRREAGRAAADSFQQFMGLGEHRDSPFQALANDFSAVVEEIEAAGFSAERTERMVGRLTAEYERQVQALIESERAAAMAPHQVWLDAAAGIGETERHLIDLVAGFEIARQELRDLAEEAAAAGESTDWLVGELGRLNAAQQIAIERIAVDFVGSLTSLGASLPTDVVMELAEAQWHLAKVQAIAAAMAIEAAGGFEGLSIGLEDVLGWINSARFERSQYFPSLPAPTVPPIVRQTGAAIADAARDIERAHEILQRYRDQRLSPEERARQQLERDFAIIFEQLGQGPDVMHEYGLALAALQEQFDAPAHETLQRYRDQRLSPWQRALQQLERDFEVVFERLGQGPDVMHEYGLALEALREQFLSGLRSFHQSMLLGGSSPLTTAQQYEVALADYQRLLAAVQAGDLGQADALQAAAETLLGLQAQMFGGTDGLFHQIRDEIGALLGGELVDAQDAFAQAQAATTMAVDHVAEVIDISAVRRDHLLESLITETGLVREEVRRLREDVAAGGGVGAA